MATVLDDRGLLIFLRPCGLLVVQGSLPTTTASGEAEKLCFFSRFFGGFWMLFGEETPVLECVIKLQLSVKLPMLDSVLLITLQAKVTSTLENAG